MAKAAVVSGENLNLILAKSVMSVDRVRHSSAMNDLQERIDGVATVRNGL